MKEFPKIASANIVVLNILGITVSFIVAANLDYENLSCKKNFFGDINYYIISIIIIYIIYVVFSVKRYINNPNAYEYRFIVIIANFISIIILNIFIFHFIYYIHGIIKIPEIVANLEWTDYLYFSISTFATLGSGELIACPNTRIFVGLQSLSGVFTMSLIVSATIIIFSKKS